MSGLTLERYDKDAQRIMRGGEIAAMCLRLSNGRWGLYDVNEKRLPVGTFPTPRAALDACVDLITTLATPSTNTEA